MKQTTNRGGCSRFLRPLFVMLLTLVMGTGGAWADNYLPGSWNGDFTIDSNVKFTDNTLTLSLAANTTYTFKIYDTGTDGTSEKWYGNSGTMTDTNHLGWTFGTDNTNNCSLTTTSAGDYTFTISWSGDTPTLSVISWPGIYTWTGGSTSATTFDATAWNTASNWGIETEFTSGGPGVASSGLYGQEIDLYGITSGTTPQLEGWNFRMHAENSIFTISDIKKFQGDVDIYLTLSKASHVTMNFDITSAGGGNSAAVTFNMVDGTANILDFVMARSYNKGNAMTVNYGTLSSSTTSSTLGQFNASIYTGKSNITLNKLVVAATISDAVNSTTDPTLHTLTLGNVDPAIALTLGTSITAEGYTAMTHVLTADQKFVGNYSVVRDATSGNLILYWVTGTKADATTLTVASGETKKLSEEGINFSSITVEEGGTLVVDETYDLTKISGAGNIELATDYTLTSGTTLSVTGKLTIDSNKTLNLGNGIGSAADISKFTSVELNGTIFHWNQNTTINGLYVPAGSTGTIISKDQGAIDSNYGITLAGTTTVDGSLRLENAWKSKYTINALASTKNVTTGSVTITGNSNGDSTTGYSGGTSSNENATYTITNASAYLGSFTVNNSKATVNVSGALVASTWTKTYGTLNYSGTSLNGTTLDGVTLSGSSLAVAGNVEFKNITSIPAMAVASGAKAKLNTSSEYTLSNVISGDGAVEIAAGTVTLDADNTFTGALTVASGATVKNVASKTSFGTSTEIAGAGTITLADFPTTTPTTNTSWTGTVNFPASTDAGDLTVKYNVWGNASSTVTLVGDITGYFSTGTVNPTVNIPTGITLTVADGSDAYTPVLTKVAGAGSLSIGGTNAIAATISDASTYTGTCTLNNANAALTVNGNLGASTWTNTSGKLYYAGKTDAEPQVNGTSFKNVTLAGSKRIYMASNLTIDGLAGNNQTAGANNYAIYGTGGTLTLKGTCDFTKKSDGTANTIAVVGVYSGNTIAIADGATVTTAGMFTNSTTASNGAITVGTGSTLNISGAACRATTITNNGTIVISSLLATSDGITMNDGSSLTISKTIEGKINKADDATVTLNVTSPDGLTLGTTTTIPTTDGEGTGTRLFMTDPTNSNLASADVTVLSTSATKTLSDGNLSDCGDGIYYVVTSAGTASAINTSGLKTVSVQPTGTLTVDANLTPTKITATSNDTNSPSIIINKEYTLDATAQGWNQTIFRALIKATSGEGTIKLNQAGTSGNLRELQSWSHSEGLTFNANYIFIGAADLSFAGTKRNPEDVITIAAGKTVQLTNAVFDNRRSILNVNGTLEATSLNMGHPEGDYPCTVNINNGGTLKIGGIVVKNYASSGTNNSQLNMVTGGTLEFTSSADITDAITAVTNAKYAFNITGGTIKADANTTIVSGIPMSIGNVTVATESGKTLTLNNAIAMTGTISNNGTLDLSGATLSAASENVFSGYSDANPIPVIVKTGTDATTTLATSPTISINSTNVAITREDQYDLILPVKTVTLASTNNVGNVATFCAAYNTQVADGTTACYASAYTDGTVTLTAISDGVIKAGTGVILIGTGESAGVTATLTDATEEITTNYLHGCATETTLDADVENVYVLIKDNSNAIFRALDTSSETTRTFSAGKAYLQTSSGDAARQSISIVFENPTGIDAVQNGSNVQNVQGSIYDLNGRKLNNLQRGVNIVNGKKVIR